MEWVLLFGKGSGKDWLAAKFISYLAYIVLSLNDPAKELGLAINTPLAILNVAPSEDLARQVFFAYLRQFISTPIFAAFLPDPKHQILVDEIRFPQANLTLFSKHSRAAGLDGYNLLAWVMDEADEFLDNQKVSNADIIHNVLRSSCNTRLRNRWIGMVISYPRTANGFMMRLYERASKDASFYCDRAATWEVRPDISRDDPGIASDYANDPRDAAARYECIPMSTEDAFFETPEKITEAVDASRTPCAVIVENIFTRELHDGSLAEYVGGCIEGITPQPGYTYFLGADGGHSGDSFTVAVFHIDESHDVTEWLCPKCGSYDAIRQCGNYRRCSWQEPFAGNVYCGSCSMPLAYITGNNHVAGWWRREGTQEAPVRVGDADVFLPRVMEDLLIEFKPRKAMRPGERNRTVDFLSVQEVCRQLIDALPVTQARFDPWNTAQMVQGL